MGQEISGTIKLWNHARFSIYQHVREFVALIARQWGAADAEMKDSAVENAKLTCFPLTAWSGSEYDPAASPTARNILVVNIYLTAPLTIIKSLSRVVSVLAVVSQ